MSAYIDTVMPVLLVLLGFITAGLGVACLIYGTGDGNIRGFFVTLVGFCVCAGIWLKRRNQE